MLEAGDRQLLLEALQPPDGYRFDQGIATTYSLDLLALLMAPLAFTFFDQRREEGAAYDSLEVLESLRRYADRLTLFCHAGRTSIPRAQYPQLAFLEQSVVECLPQNDGAFHPKVWVLRFTGPGPARYRMLCLSRNLVFAQSWDTVLSLDGELLERTTGVSASRPLAEFIEALPQHAARRVTADVANRIATISAELRLTKFEAPDGFEDFIFWPFGMPGKRQKSPFGELGSRLLIVSPFLSASTIEKLSDGRSETTIVSTAHALETLPRRPAGVQQFYVLNDRAQVELEAGSENANASIADVIQLRDLHAKLYVTELGREAHLWTGSANATASGLGRNVEFLVELIGPKRLFGIDAMMVAQRDAVRFITLLTPATDLVAKEAPNSDQEALEKKLDEVRTSLAGAALEARVEANGESFNVGVWCPAGKSVQIDPGIEVKCRPSTIAPQSGLPVASGTGARMVVSFTSLTHQALTSFFAFEVSGRVGACEQQLGFVLNLPLIGAPEGRKEAVLRSLLQDRRRLMRFLMLLLADEGAAVPAFGDMMDGENGSRSDSAGGFSANGLFEMLMRALDLAPHRLDHLETLLTQLRQGSEGADPLPEGFDAIWQPILARRRARQERT